MATTNKAESKSSAEHCSAGSHWFVDGVCIECGHMGKRLREERARRTTIPATELTDAELVEGVTPAVFYSGIHAAQCYGLVDGPSVNDARCCEIIDEARRRGLEVPTLEQAVELWLEGVRRDA